MKLFTFILSGILMASAPQQDAKQFWDNVLQAYEQLCDACMAHKSSKEIGSLTKKFNDMLKTPVGKMDEEQTRRFAQIQNKYRGIISFAGNPVPVSEEPGRLIKVDTVRKVEHLQIIDTAFVKEVLGEVEIIQTSTSKDTVIHIIQYNYPQIEKPAVQEVAAAVPEPVVTKPVKVKPERVKKERDPWTNSIFALGSVELSPDLAIGGMAGVVDKWGIYVKFLTNNKPIHEEFNCDSKGNSSFGQIWTTGTEAFSRMVATAGAAYEISDHIIAYAGTGYGFANLYWQDYNWKWMKVSDYSQKGVALDLGVIIHAGVFAVSLGTNLTGFKYLDIELGLGLFF